MTTPPPPSAELDHELVAFNNEYERRSAQYHRVLEQVLALFEEYRRIKNVFRTEIREPTRIKNGSPKERVHSIRGRVKSAASLAKKARRQLKTLHPEAVFIQIKDIVGVRIVCNTLDGKRAACEWIESLPRERPQLFTIAEQRTVEYKTGYRSRHYLINLPHQAWPTLRLDPSDDDEHVTVEVQVRTILEEAWGEIEHDLVYKTADSELTADESWQRLKSGFVALSHRLHDADVMVEHLTKGVAKERAVSRVARKERSLAVDPEKLGIDDPTARALFASVLREAEDLRLRGDHRAAYEKHAAIYTDGTFTTGLAAKVLLNEMALDRIYEAETELARSRAHHDAVAAQLDEALALYERSESLEPRMTAAIPNWRRSRICVLRQDYVQALAHLRSALQEIELEGIPAFVTAPFYKGAIKSRIGAIYLGLYEQGRASASVPTERLEELRDKAFDALVGAVGDLSPETNDGRRSRTKPEWIVEYFTAHNNLAAYHCAVGDPVAAGATLAKARATIDSSLWEQDIYFVVTMFQVELADLKSRAAPTLAELTWLDSLRIRILNMLSTPGTYMTRDEIEDAMRRITEFEELWRSQVLAAPSSDTMKPPAANAG